MQEAWDQIPRLLCGQTKTPQQLSPQEAADQIAGLLWGQTKKNATTTFDARSLGPNPPPSFAFLENNYPNRLWQLGSNNLTGISRHPFQSNSIETMSSGSGANFSGPMFRQSKKEPPQQQRNTQRPYSLDSAGTVISPYQNPLNGTPAPPLPRALSSSEVPQFTVGRLFREPENHTKHIPTVHQQPLAYSDGAPPVTVVMEGHSICQTIFLEEHSCYESFAQNLRGMFVGSIEEADLIETKNYCNLSNAIPGYLIAYEDNEGDLLLTGDLSWKDFVGAAKRIRILAAKDRGGQSRVRRRES